MPQISYPTNIRVSGPWLLDDKQVSLLDGVFNEFQGRLEEEKRNWIQQTTDRDFGDEIEKIADPAARAARKKYFEERVSTRRLDPDRRSLTVLLKGGRSLTARTFAEALRHAEAGNEKALGFYYNSRVGNIEASVNIEKEYARGDLSVSVKPASSQLARELFGALRNWADDVQSRPWVRWWFLARNACRVFLMFWIVFGLMYGLFPRTESAKSVYKERARQLLEKGISQQNLNDAIAALLAIESEYPAPNVPVRSGPDYWRIFLGGASLLALLSVCPRICIGMWAGKRSLLWWRIWINLIWVTIPGSLLWPRLVSMIFRL
jgi:hypothetical protein